MSLKLITSLCVFAFAAAAQASFQSVPSDKVGDYRQAINDAISKSTIQCLNQPFSTRAPLREFDLYNFVNQSDISLESTGAQPVLLLVKDNGTSRDVITITTSADYRTIAKFTFVGYEIQNQNVGNLINPNYQPVTKEVSRLDCGGVTASLK